VISTHSNIVVRELAYDDSTKVFRVWRDNEDHTAPSFVEEVPRTPTVHVALLRELGYEFADLGLHEGWLFLEESSAETVINEILIPTFTPQLEGRLRTFSAGGVSKIESSLDEFQRLVTFVHLQPAYQDRLWVRADGDDAGKATVSALRSKFPYLTDATCRTFTAPDFEHYYPAEFQDRVSAIVNLQERSVRRREKAKLLQEVLEWTRVQGPAAIGEWEASASEPIKFLRKVASIIGAPSR
jgi:hypothetical protein